MTQITRPALALILCGLLLTACGSGTVPAAPLDGSVSAPDTIGSTAALNFTITHTDGCNDVTLQVTSRTASTLALTLTRNAHPADQVCPAVTQTVSYSDPGSPARSTPFTITLNGTPKKTLTVTSP